MFSHQRRYEAAITKLVSDARFAISEQAAFADVSEDALTKAVVAELVGEERYADGRASHWSVRMRIYDWRRLNEPEVDSDADLPWDAPGATIVRGLPAVLTLIVDQATSYHRAACAGLDMATLKRKARNLRTQMSNRGDGSGTLRAEYEVKSGDVTQRMMLRCDVQRVSESQAADTPTEFVRRDLRIMSSVRRPPINQSSIPNE